MLLEFKINIEETPEKYVDGLILGLVRSGYDTYLSFNKENVCFNGHSEEVISNDITIKEKR